MQPDRVPDAGLVPIDKVTEEASPVTVLPPASSTVTWGWLVADVQATPPVPPPGCWVKTSLAAGPTVMLKAEDVGEVRLPSVAFRV